MSEDHYPYTGVGEFAPYDRAPLSEGEMRERASSFYELMAQRRSIRTFDTAHVPRDLIETAILTAGTAPSGAHQQPWTFVVVGDPETKHRIRIAAEEEERTNYLDGRMPEDWQEEISRLGTSWQKPYLEDAPWIVVLFEQRYGVDGDGSRRKHYYVKESAGIAAGVFITALHNMGLVTLTHTPSPMAFLTKLLNRPANERPFILFPIGYPAAGSVVPRLVRKPLQDILVEYPANQTREIPESFVPEEFDVPIEFEGPGFRLEPLGPQHNERDRRVDVEHRPHPIDTRLLADRRLADADEPRSEPLRPGGACPRFRDKGRLHLLDPRRQRRDRLRLYLPVEGVGPRCIGQFVGPGKSGRYGPGRLPIAIGMDHRCVAI